MPVVAVSGTLGPHLAAHVQLRGKPAHASSSRENAPGPPRRHPRGKPVAADASTLRFEEHDPRREDTPTDMHRLVEVACGAYGSIALGYAEVNHKIKTCLRLHGLCRN